MKNLLLLLSVIFSTNTYAAKSNFAYSMPAAEVGFRWSTANLTGADSNKQDLGFQVGGSIVIDFAKQFGLKTGLFYVERSFKSEFPGTISRSGKLTYFEVPAFIMFKLEDYAGVYAGPSFGVKLGDEYSSGALAKIESIVIPITFGAQFKFLPNLGVNLFFETVPGSLATGIESSRAVGANLMFMLD